MSEGDLAARSVAAVTGRVTDIEATADPVTDGINTYIHIEPTRVLFGSLPAGVVVLRETGGRLGGENEWIYGSPEYRVGEDVLVFLSEHADGTLHTTALAMGKFTLEADARGVLTAVRQLGEGAAIWDLQRGELVEDPGPEVYEFERLVATARGAKPATAVRRLGQHAAITLEPPELARAALREHQESFTYLSTPARWFEPDDGVPVAYLIDAIGDVGLGPTTSRAAINDAFAAWNNVPAANLVLKDGGTLSPPVTFAGCTGGNRIVFNDPFGEITDPTGCGGVLAVGGFCSSSETRVVNGTTFRRIRVGKVTFNNGWSSCPGWNRCNLAEVATHEIGHTIGFGHSPDYTATMYAAAHFDGRCASLRSDDIAGVSFVYPMVATPVPTATATKIPPTPTFTPLPPTATRTPTATHVPSTPTSTLPPPPTNTATAAPTSTPTAVPRYQVRGHVMYNDTRRGVPNVTVSLQGQAADSTRTSDAGDYGFDSVAEGSWELVAQKGADNTGTAITPLDAAYVLQAVVELRSFNAAQRLACDTTGDGQLSALDATRILQLSVGMIDRLPVAESCGSDWTFTPDPAPMQLQSIVDPVVAGGVCTDGKIMLEDLLQDATDQNFHAVLFGDCTGNWTPPSMAGLERPGTHAARVRLAHPARRGRRVRLPVYVRAATPYQALDLQLGYDPARMTPVGVVAQGRGNGVIASFHARQPGVVRIAMASGRPIERRFALLVDFALAEGVSDPGRVRALSARIDEAVALVTGSAAR